MQSMKWGVDCMRRMLRCGAHGIFFYFFFLIRCRSLPSVACNNGHGFTTIIGSHIEQVLFLQVHLLLKFHLIIGFDLFPYIMSYN